MPFTMSWLVPMAMNETITTNDNNMNRITIDPGPLMLQLFFTVILPTAIGKICNSYGKSIKSFSKRHKMKLTFVSTFCLAITPFMQVRIMILLLLLFFF